MEGASNYISFALCSLITGEGFTSNVAVSGDSGHVQRCHTNYSVKNNLGESTITTTNLKGTEKPRAAHEARAERGRKWVGFGTEAQHGLGRVPYPITHPNLGSKVKVCSSISKI